MNKKYLVSIIILSYKNYRYIYEAIESVLSQNYSNIELIISNDGSNDFDKEALYKYFKKNTKPNIKKIIINNNCKNLGTVKNINKVVRLSTGEYIVMFAADDTFYDNQVITKFVEAFNSLPKSELIITSQIGMYDTNLKNLIQLFISEEYKKKLTSLSPKQLFSEMAVHCFIPGSGTVYKRKLFEKYGYFDEKYVLVEDYSTSLKLLRLGIKYNYFDFISFKHRDGGISHGNIIGDTSAGEKYEKDIINIMNNEIKPYFSFLNQKQQQKFFKMRNDREINYFYKYQYKNSSLSKKIVYFTKHSKSIGLKLIKSLAHNGYRRINQNAVNLIVLGILLISIYFSNLDYNNNFVSIIQNKNISKYIQKLNSYCLSFGIIIITTSILANTFKQIKPIFSTIKNLIKS